MGIVDYALTLDASQMDEFLVICKSIGFFSGSIVVPSWASSQTRMTVTDDYYTD